MPSFLLTILFCAGVGFVIALAYVIVLIYFLDKDMSDYD